ncbi:MAG: 16S rRNA (guanine(527)-N(7))-methyltransferase RsmG [Lactobacillales bacterium]|jgi:16S rRNA (guanine527-N7)-methyltransferase|nr:16S rRNA (guanine(527)-N(7))-methyltransferase RsmG [Lactobacillales bacterium]
MLENFVSNAKKFGFELEESVVEKFQLYMEALLYWNQKINLTAITSPKEIAIKHFLDSLTLSKYLNFDAHKRVIDVGTGAGFPGIPLKIFFPKLSLTLLDKLNKRLIFLNNLLTRLNLKADIWHLRAEEGGQKPELREKCVIAVSRAVAKLPILAEYCIPYIKIGGIFAAMKGPDAAKEISEANHIIDLLGGKIENIENFSLPDGSHRMIILIRKIKKTSENYPRKIATIKKALLKLK